MFYAVRPIGIGVWAKSHKVELQLKIEPATESWLRVESSMAKWKQLIAGKFWQVSISLIIRLKIAEAKRDETWPGNESG